MIFPSKRDWWLVAILVIASAVQFVVGSKLLIEGPERWPGVLLILAAAFIGWLMQSTYYIVGDTNLVIRSGPFHWTVPVEGIESITPTHNPLSSPALSLDRLWFSYRRGGRKRAVMISPLDKEGFLKAVAARVKGLVVEGQSAKSEFQS